MSQEEIKVIITVLDTLRAKGFNLISPLPTDTLFLTEIFVTGRCSISDVSRSRSARVEISGIRSGSQYHAGTTIYSYFH